MSLLPRSMLRALPVRFSTQPALPSRVSSSLPSVSCSSRAPLSLQHATSSAPARNFSSSSASASNAATHSHHSPSPSSSSWHANDDLPSQPPTPAEPVRGMLTLDSLRSLIADGSITQVILCFPDLYGRLLGKRFDAEFFLSSALKDGTHACNYLLAMDIEHQPGEGYQYAHWEKGYGDFHLKPDWSSLRLQAWTPGTATVICDVWDERSATQRQKDGEKRKGAKGTNGKKKKKSNGMDEGVEEEEAAEEQPNADSFLLKAATPASSSASLSPAHSSASASVSSASNSAVHEDAPHRLLEFAPRSVLHRQLNRAANFAFASSSSASSDPAAASRKFLVYAASELEYYTYHESYEQARKVHYEQSRLTPVGLYLSDYHLLQTAREEPLSSEFRRHLRESGVPVETSKGECGKGQHELNVRFSDALTMSDRHSIYKQCLKEVAAEHGKSVTFMAKPFKDATGSGCHIHLSLFDAVTNKNAFVGDRRLGDTDIRCSDLFIHFLAGWLKYTPEVFPFYAPTVNSYKRFVSSSWAPTRLAWSYDNRTAGFRIVGHGQSLRIECRIPGADAQIYLAFAASLASGMRGVQEKLEPPPMFAGNIYQAKALPHVPRSLHEAIKLFEKSKFARESFGDEVVDHYTTFFKNEQAAFDAAVTDWERERYFEQI